MVKKTSKILIDKNTRTFSPIENVKAYSLDSFRPVYVSDTTSEVFVTYNDKPQLEVVQTSPALGSIFSLEGAPKTVQFVFAEPYRDSVSGTILFDNAVVPEDNLEFYDEGRILWVNVSGLSSWSGQGAHNVKISSNSFIENGDSPPKNLSIQYTISTVSAPSLGNIDPFSLVPTERGKLRFIRNPVKKGTRPQNIINEVLKHHQIRPAQVVGVEPNGANEVIIAYADTSLHILDSYPRPGAVIPVGETPTEISFCFSEKIDGSIKQGNIRADLIDPDGVWYSLSGNITSNGYALSSNVSGLLEKEGHYKTMFQVSSGIQSIYGEYLARPYIIPFSIDTVARVTSVNGLVGAVTGISGSGGGAGSLTGVNPGNGLTSDFDTINPTLTVNGGPGITSSNTGVSLVLPSTAPPDISSSSSVGAATLAARSDHTHRGVTSIDVTGNSGVGIIEFAGAGSVSVFFDDSAGLVTVSGSTGAGGGGGAPVGSSYVTMSSDGDLTNERVLTAGDGISLVDGGGNSTATIGLSSIGSPGFYGSSSGYLQLEINEFGQVTGITSGTIQIDVSQINNHTENIQDIVGAMWDDGATVDFTYDDGVGSMTAEVIPSAINHDALFNFVSNEHINHTGVEITGANGITGGGDISTSRTLWLADTAVSPQEYGSSIEVGQFTVDQQGRITAAADVVINHDGLLNFVANEHVDHTSIVISGASGVTGWGTIDSNVILYGNLGTTSPLSHSHTGNAGVSDELARIDHVHRGVSYIDIKANSSQGSNFSMALADGLLTITGQSGIFLSQNVDDGALIISSAAAAVDPPPDIVVQAETAVIDSADAGISTRFAKEDHVHVVCTSGVLGVGASNQSGSSSCLAAADHIHQGVHGITNQSGSSLLYGDVSISGKNGITTLIESDILVVSGDYASVSRVQETFTATGSYTFTHNLGYYPHVTVLTSSLKQTNVTITHSNTNELVLSFAGAMTNAIVFGSI